MPARECVGAARCPYGAECFAEASRARAREADIVVTNHSLLAVDMLAGRHIVPPHKLLVVDEAHELADRVSSAAQAELTPELIDRSARRARPLLRPETAEALTASGDALAVGLAEAPAGRITSGLPDPLREACTLLDAATRAALDSIGDIKADDPDPVRKQQAKAALDELSSTAQRLLEEAEDDVAWVERNDATGRRALMVAPLSVAGTLATHLYDERTVVATSATLALGGRFDTVARALGLEAPATRSTVTGRRRPGRGLPPSGRGSSRRQAGHGGPHGRRDSNGWRSGRRRWRSRRRRARVAVAGRRLAIRLRPPGDPLRGGAPAPPRCLRVTRRGRGGTARAGHRAGWSYARAVLVATGRAAGGGAVAGADRPDRAVAG